MTEQIVVVTTVSKPSFPPGDSQVLVKGTGLVLFEPQAPSQRRAQHAVASVLGNVDGAGCPDWEARLSVSQGGLSG